VNSGLKKNFGYDGLVVGVEAAAGELQWLSEFFEPAFDVADGIPDVTIKHEVDPLRFEQLVNRGPSGNGLDVFVLDKRVVRFPQWRIPEVDLAFYDGENELLYLLQRHLIVLLTRHYPRKLRTCLMRTVRELAMGVVQRNGGRYLHAAAFALGGQAAIILGPKGAGKTSLLTYILKNTLENTQAKFLANDRLMCRQQDSTAYVRGMPTFISIRQGIFDLFPGLEESLKTQRFSARSTLGECRKPGAPDPKTWSDGRRGLSPTQYCSLMDCDAVKAATGAVMIFPSQTREKGGLSLQKLHPDRVEDLLRGCLFEKIRPDRLSEVLSIFPPGPNSDCMVSDDELCRGLTERVPGYECLLGNDAYADTAGADKLVGLLADQVPRAGQV